MISRQELSRRKALNAQGKWEVPDNIDQSKFDFSWRPHQYERPYIHVFGTAENVDAGPRYIVPENEGWKFQDSQIAKLKPLFEPSETCAYWQVPDNIDTSTFDFEWLPDEHDLPYIHEFGTQWQPTGGPRYVVNGATQIKYQTSQHAIHKPDITRFVKLIEDELDFDYSWHPNANDPPFIYIFGNQWNDAATEPTLQYSVSGATEVKYVTNCFAKVKPNLLNWIRSTDPAYENFDYSWRPNPHSPPLVYQWENNGPIYTMPGVTQVVLMKNFKSITSVNVPQYYINTTLDDLIQEHKSETFWALNPDINYSNFDFSWRPNQSNFMHINVFGTDHSKDIRTYYINGPAWELGNRKINYVDNIKVNIETNLDMFYVVVGSESDHDFDELEKKYPNIQRTRFATSWIETIKRCIKKAKTKLIWILSSEYDYPNTSLNFYPNSWQQHMLHVISSQWNRWSHVYLVNCETFLIDSEYIREIEHLPNINHVRTIKVQTNRCYHDAVFIDFGNDSADHIYQVIKQRIKNVYRINYDSGYLNTIRNFINENPVIKQRVNYSIWVTSSLCDYVKFDFSWYSDPFQRNQIHVFSSRLGNESQKFGDTFLIPVTELLPELDNLDNLIEYSKNVNFISYITAQRQQHPIIKHTSDSQVDAVLSHEIEPWPYAEFQTPDFIGARSIVPSVWDSKTSDIIVGSQGASQIIVPAAAKSLIKHEIYDYPYIVKEPRLDRSRNLDIVFISNSEPCAEQNWQRLQTVLAAKKITNKVHRVKDIKGRVASQIAAANQSNTAWYFLVNGKIEINENFDWSWHPDRLQQPKHYIFTVTNPVNGLEYGHQAIVANNKNLTLSTVPTGLDFTLNSLHEVVDMNCGIARYNTDAWTTWRTAFRESIKLRNNTDEISKNRLNSWLTMANGDYGEWSILGARDGVEYWESVDGELEKLMLSYDWQWIQDLFNSRYK
jgi:hypothetical protein